MSGNKKRAKAKGRALGWWWLRMSARYDRHQEKVVEIYRAIKASY